VTRTILTLNAGSSSLKFALFDANEERPRRLAVGELEGIGVHPHLLVKGAEGAVLADEDWVHGEGSDPHEEPMARVMRWIEQHFGEDRVCAVGHRVVHGGAEFHAPVRITPDVYVRLEALTPFAPLHQPACLGPVRAFLRQHPDLPQVACFDTGFHHGMPAVARHVALPSVYDRKGVRRYGFHGLSYEHIVDRLSEEQPEAIGKRVLVAHVGNGASLCAIRDGKSVATTMGFSVLDGMMMGTRCGHIDPGVLLYMLQEEGMDASRLETLLYHEAGLQGVSGVSSDMRALREKSADPAVRMALDLFVYRFAEQVGAMMMALGGVDILVFTAGIGEHDAAFRAAACACLFWMGVRIDEAANAGHRAVISTPESSVAVQVMPADEEATIIRHVRSVLKEGSKS